MENTCPNCDKKFILTRKEQSLAGGEYALFCSISCLADYIADHPMPPTDDRIVVPRPSRMGRTPDFKSDSERVVYEFFKTLLRVRILYEPCAIRLPNGDRYVPDFVIPDYNIFLEVKGRWAIGAKRKTRKVFDLLPEGAIFLIPDYLVRNARFKYNLGKEVIR
jgi:hypothetical protein